MGITMEQQQVRDLLTETVTLLCKNGLQFNQELGIEALIGITLDKEEVFLVSIKETIFSDRYETIHNSSANPSFREEALESVESSLVLQTFLGKECLKGTQQSESSNQKSYSVVVDNDTVSVTKSRTSDNSSSCAKKAEVLFEEIDDAMDILSCNNETLCRRRRRGGNNSSNNNSSNNSSQTSLTVEFDQKNNFSTSSPAVFKTENTECDVTETSVESCVIEMKREAVDDDEAVDHENGENSTYIAVGSLYANAFDDDCNDWDWKPNHWRRKRTSEKMTSDKQLHQCSTSSSTSIWNARSQKSKAARQSQSCMRNDLADVRPDETDARRCPICGTVSLNWNMYLRHIRKHQPGMYRCPFCGKSFSGSTNLRGHLAVHTNIREFACHLCDKAYAYKKDLSEHLLVKHGQFQSRFHLQDFASFSPTAASHRLDNADLLEVEDI